MIQFNTSASLQMLKNDTIKTISNFIFVQDPLVKADLIIVPGSSHKQLPLKAVQLFKKGFAKNILFLGGINEKLNKNESEWGSEIARDKNVPEKNIYIETRSTNTKENAQESLKLIKDKNLPHKKVILVSKPYHARRLKMTFQKLFTNSELRVIPVTDDRKIEKNNWWKDNMKSQKVMEELGKISEYYLKGDLSFS